MTAVAMGKGFDTIVAAREAIAAVEAAATALGDARTREMVLEDDRPLVKQAATRRIMEREPNPLTGKPHSASSAEAIVETDEGYAAHRKLQREAVLATERARGAYAAAKLRAKLAVEVASS